MYCIEYRLLIGIIIFTCTCTVPFTPIDAASCTVEPSYKGHLRTRIYIEVVLSLEVQNVLSFGTIKPVLYLEVF